MVYHDTLTGLLNRTAFQQNVERELTHAKRYGEQRALLFIDLDKFKTVNDTYGHDAGDQLLQEFASRAGKTLRETDSIYRLGGDEFAILLTNPKNQKPEIAARRVVDITAKPFLLETHTIDFVTASIGISIFPDNGQDIETLLQCSDHAMYEAKEKGNCFSIYGKPKKS
jgi:diguanylate cyclase (GGDEF)-like protein